MLDPLGVGGREGVSGSEPGGPHDTVFFCSSQQGGDVSSLLVRDPPPLPALWAHLVAKGQ